MSFPKIPFLLGVISATSLAAHAQTQKAPAPQRSLTTVDAAGNVVLSPRANGTSFSTSSDRSRRNRGRNDSFQSGGIYYAPPVVPYYGYPYAPPINNFYYPAQPSTTIVGQTNYAWQKPVTITSVPLGGYYGGYPAPGYPAPGYPYPATGYGYGYPTGGYPAPNYGYPAYGYPAYPGYGNTTTYIYGNAPGTIYSQSQNGGYGISLGRGGFSVQLGNQRSTSTTTVTRY